MVANAIEAGLPQQHVLLNNVTLPIEAGSTQIDHVLITTAVETGSAGGMKSPRL